jgi:uncharacterized protein (TIGR03435 family)
MVYQLAPGGLFSAQNVSVRFLIRLAYGVKDFQVIGGPAWLSSERYDLRARADGVSDPGEMISMLQRLLADRFRLKTYNDTKELPIYDLMPAKRGLKLQVAQPGSCFVSAPNVPMPAPRPGDSAAYVCGKTYYLVRNRILARGVKISSFADGIASRVGRIVVDKTDDSGTYDIDLQWNVDQTSSTAHTAEPELSQDLDDMVHSIAIALQNQLGLRLQPDRSQVRVIVIDDIQRPSEN